MNQPPNSPDSEQAIIACIVQHGKTEQAVREFMDRLTPEMFFFARNREIYSICQDLETIDYGLIVEAAKQQNSAVDLTYLVEIKRAYTSLSNIKAHVRTVINSYYQRQLIAIGNNVAEQALAKQKPEDIKHYCLEQFKDLEEISTYEPQHIADLMPGYLDTLNERAQNKNRQRGIETGIEDLDKQIAGLDKNWLFVLAGRPSHGKSLVAQIIANHISRSATTIFFSMEMSQIEILDRFVCLNTGMNEKDVRQALLSDDQLMKLRNLANEVKDGKINQIIDPTPNLSLEQIRSRVIQAKKKYPNLGLIQIDYLGLMKLRNDKFSRNDLAIGDITKGLKSLAKEVQIPIMLLVQCNRASDNQKRLNMGNLADSASIERDADLVIFTHRDEVNNPETPKKGIIELTCGKFRHGTFNQDVYLKREAFGYECVDPSPYKVSQKPYKKKGFDLEGAA